MDDLLRFIHSYLTDDAVDYVRFTTTELYPGFEITVTYKDGSEGLARYYKENRQWSFTQHPFEHLMPDRD